MEREDHDTQAGEEEDQNPAALRALVAEYLERAEAAEDVDAPLEELSAAYPEQAEGLRRRVALLRDMGLLRGATADDGAGVPERLGDFRILGPLGTGGMGVIYLARQESLGREVALKLVRPEQLYFRGARERFHREVTTVARLQHPGIVPVYSVGEESGVPYFAMERVRGVTLADARTDVYGLGVTLYELLTLCLPYEQRTTTVLSFAIVTGTPPPPRRANRSLSWEAETACLVAMDRDPERRYATAGDLARDLANVLEKRPIRARRAGSLRRARRWVERHPARTAAFALGFLSVFGTPSLLALQRYRANAELEAKSAEVSAANERLSESLTAEEAERAFAERKFERAFEAVELMLSRVGGKTLREIPGMEAVRRWLLTEALRLNEDLLAERSDDPRHRRLYALTLQCSALIHGFLQENRQALARLGERRAIAELDPLVASGAAPFEAPTTLGWARIELCQVLQKQGRADEARVELERTVDELRPVCESDGATSEPRYLLAKALHFLATPLEVLTLDTFDAVQLDEAVALLEEAVALRKELALEPDHDPGAVSDLALSHTSLGNTLAGLGQLEGAEEHYARGGELMGELARDYPLAASYVEGEGTAFLNIGNLGLMRGDFEAAARSYERALEVFERLHARLPDNLAYSGRLVYVLYLLADCALRDAEHERTLQLAARGLELGGRLPRTQTSPLPQVMARMTATRSEALSALSRHEEGAAAARDVLQYVPRSTASVTFLPQYRVSHFPTVAFTGLMLDGNKPISSCRRVTDAVLRYFRYFRKSD